MKRKMALLEQAHGLLCNAPGEGGSEQDAETWRKLRAEWIERWAHVIADQQTKEHNRHIAVGNDAIDDYEGKRSQAVPVARIELGGALITETI